MAATRLLPDKATLERHRREGLTYADIATRYGVTEQAVWARMKHDGIRTANRADHSALIPWQVRKEHANTFPILMLRTLSRRRQGIDNTPERERMLDNWLANLKAQNAVVCYDPEMWPNPASPKLGGWFYAKRRKSDGDSIIRYAKPGKGLPKR
jgi:hypothetical protein